MTTLRIIRSVLKSRELWLKPQRVLVDVSKYGSIPTEMNLSPIPG